jgi:hypothetical protein
MRCLRAILAAIVQARAILKKRLFEFSALKSCIKKRMRIREEPTGGSHQTVVFREPEKTHQYP